MKASKQIDGARFEGCVLDRQRCVNVKSACSDVYLWPIESRRVCGQSCSPNIMKWADIISVEHIMFTCFDSCQKSL